MRMVALRDLASPKGLIGGPFGSSLVGSDYVHAGVPVVRGANLGKTRTVVGPFAFVTAEKVSRDLARNTAKPGDLVFTQRGTLGQVALVPDGEYDCYVVSQSQMRMRVNASITSASYLYYACSTPLFLQQIDDNAIATGVPHINLGILGRLEVPFFDLKYQHAIVDVLGALDDKVAANGVVARTAQALARVRYDASIATRHESSVHSLADITCMLTRGITPRYSESPDDCLVLNQKCVRDQWVSLASARRTVEAKVTTDKVLQLYDVVVNSTGQGTLGRVARWTSSERATTDSHITIVRFDQCLVDQVCAGQALLALQDLIESMGEGSTGQTELSRGELGKLRLPLPSLSVQRSLGRELATLAELEASVLAENRMLAATRDELLPRLMSGRLRVKDAEAVAESVL